MICAQRSVVLGIRLLVFHRLYDGAYKGKMNAYTRRRCHAMSRIMVASAHMRDPRIRGGGADGDEDGEIYEITICNVHLNHKTSTGMLGYNNFWDQLAKYLCMFRPRFLCGDFGSALFNVVPELRARGFQINLAAWHCWVNSGDVDQVMMDDEAIFRLGPCKGIRMCFDASVFGFTSPAFGMATGNFSVVMETENESGQRQHNGSIMDGVVPMHSYNGRSITGYFRAYPARMEQFVLNTFTPVFDENSPAVAEMKAYENNKEMFPFGVQTSLGSFSWSLPEDVPCEQKLACVNRSLPACLAPLMIFMGARNDIRGQKRLNESVEVRDSTLVAARQRTSLG